MTTSIGRQLKRSGMLLVVFALCLASADVHSMDSVSTDETAIRALAGLIVEGWNKGSGEAFAAQFAPDADYVVVNGSRIKGRPAIASGHQQPFNTFYKGTRLWLEVKSIRFLRPDVAVMHSVSSVLRPGESEKPDRPKAIQSFVISKHGNAWLIDSFQNTPIQEPGPPPAK